MNRYALPVEWQRTKKDEIQVPPTRRQRRLLLRAAGVLVGSKGKGGMIRALYTR